MSEATDWLLALVVNLSNLCEVRCLPEFVLEVYYFDYSHQVNVFSSWDALSEYVNNEVKFDDVFTLSIRAN